MPTFDETTITHFAKGADNPETVQTGPDGKVYCCGFVGQIYRADLETGEADQYATVDGARILGFALDASGNMYGCDCLASRLLRIAPDGSHRALIDSEEVGPEMGCLNTPVFDPEGNLYISDSGDWTADGQGRIWKYTPSGQLTSWYEGTLNMPNGIAWGADRALYVPDTLHESVYRIPVSDDGSPGEMECLVHMPRACPDGVTLDADGHVWIGAWRPDAIYRLWMPARRLELFVYDYRGEHLRGPTALCWAGPDRDVLIAANLGGRSLQRLDVGVVGQEINYPAL